MCPSPARSTATLLAVAAVAAAASGPAAAQVVEPGPWSFPFAVASTAPGSSSDGPTLAFGASGRGLVTWHYRTGTGHTGQRAVQRRLDGSFGPEVEIPTWIGAPFVYGLHDAVALALPRPPARRVRVVFGSTSGDFGPEQTIYTAPPAPNAVTRIAANSRGHVAVVRRDIQRNDHHRIVLVERRPGGRFGRPQLVAQRRSCATPKCVYFDGGGADVAVAVGERGDLVVVWEEGWWLKARVRRRGGRMTPAVRLGYYDRIWGGIRAAVSPSGAVWVAWFDHPVASGGGPMWIRLATRPAGARRFAPTRVLDHVRNMDFTNDQTVRLALDPGGGAFVAWHGPGPKLAELDPAGGMLRTRRLARSGDVSALAAGRRPGEALVLWAGAPEFMTGVTQMFGGVTGAGGTFTGAEAITPVAQIGSSAAGFGPGDTPLVLWTQLGAIRGATRG